MRIPELKKIYTEEAIPSLMKSQGYGNVHEVPKVQKVVLNSSSLAGQAPVVVKAKVSVSNFKLREGMPVGIKVTLRGNEMWEFLLRLIAIALPNIRDFRGVPSKLDGQGNYTLGITDHSIFPEINVERQRVNTGLDISIVTSAQTDEEGVALLKLLGMPFRKHSSDTETAQEAA